jgi:hypothetical protein
VTYQAAVTAHSFAGVPSDEVNGFALHDLSAHCASAVILPYNLLGEQRLDVCIDEYLYG